MSELENRRAKRRRVDARGVVYVEERGIFCDVLDISKTGCRIRCLRLAELPDHFELHLVGHPTFRKAWVQWRRGAEAGVSFEDPSLRVAVEI